MRHASSSDVQPYLFEVDTMDCIEVFELIEQLPIRKIVRGRSNPLDDLTCSEFQECFRLWKESTVSLLRLIVNDLTCDTERNKYVPPILQLLTASRFYATGDCASC